MQESTLFKISLSLSLIGILILLLKKKKKDLSSSNISEIINSSIEKEVKIKGIVTKITNTPGLLILNIKDNTAEIKAIAFKEKEIEINKNDIIELQGIVKKYKNELEIEASLIKIL